MFVKKVTRDYVAGAKTSELGILYMNAFAFLDQDDQAPTQLEMLRGELRNRPFDERLIIYHQIRGAVKSASDREDYKHAEIARRMMERYRTTILD